MNECYCSKITQTTPEMVSIKVKVEIGCNKAEEEKENIPEVPKWWDSR